MATCETCRTCGHYDLKAAKDRAGRVRKDWAARCLWALPGDWKFPVSVTRYRGPIMLGAAGHMLPDEGADCPTHTARQPKENSDG